MENKPGLARVKLAIVVVAAAAAVMLDQPLTSVDGH